MKTTLLQGLTWILLLTFLLTSAPVSVEACGCHAPNVYDEVTGCCLRPRPLPPPPPCPPPGNLVEILTCNPYFRCDYPKPTAACSLEVGSVVAEKRPGEPFLLPVSWAIRNTINQAPFPRPIDGSDVEPPSFEFSYSLEYSGIEQNASDTSSILDAAKGGTLKGCGATGAGTACTITPLTGGLEGTVILDPPGLSEPRYPTAIRGETILAIDCPDCETSAVVGVSIQVTASYKTPTGEVIDIPIAGSYACIELLPCDSFRECHVPTVSAPRGVVAAESGQDVPLLITVERNAFTEARLPITATVVANAAPDSDPNDIFSGFPVSVELDFEGGTTQEESFVVGCGIHGPCFQGVGNSFSVYLYDAFGRLIRSPTGVDLAEVVVTEVAAVQKRLVDVVGDELFYEITVRNPSTRDPISGIQVSDRFPSQTILSVVGGLIDIPYDDHLGHVATPAETDVGADIRIRGDKLEISGFGLGVRDFNSIRVFPDVALFHVKTRAEPGLLVGPPLPSFLPKLAAGPRLPASPASPRSALSPVSALMLNAGPTMKAKMLVSDEEGEVRALKLREHGAPVWARCISPQSVQFWRTHHSGAAEPQNVLRWEISPSTALCGQTWMGILTREDEDDSGWLGLAQEWIAASLNAAAGAPMPGAVDDAMTEARVFIESCAVAEVDRPEVVRLTDAIRRYNRDKRSPGHCTEAFAIP